jgi:hypothetical protein
VECRANALPCLPAGAVHYPWRELHARQHSCQRMQRTEKMSEIQFFVPCSAVVFFPRKRIPNGTTMQ